MTAVIDTHQHFWDPAHGAPGWLDPTDPLHRRFDVPELDAARCGTGVRTALSVQAENTIAETLTLLDRAGRVPWIAGVIGWLDPTGDVPAQLARLRRHPAGRLLVGVRLSLRGPTALARFRDHRDRVLDGLADLTQAGLALDVLAGTTAFTDVADIASAHPALPVVLDHLGQPTPTGIGQWRAGLGVLAQYGSVRAKVSGLRTALTEPADRRAAVTHAVHVFGHDRLLLGSDWPVSTTSGGYGHTVGELVDLLGPDSPALARTAEATYRLAEPRDAGAND